MDIIDLKYCGILSSQLEGFAVKSTQPYRANMRCPVCGDSASNKHKKRGWLLEQRDNSFVAYYCHNCNASMNLDSFISTVASSLSAEYHKEKNFAKYRDNNVSKVVEKKQDDITKIRRKPPSLRALKGIGSLNIGHSAKKYVTSRGIPSRKHYRLFYVKNFNAWINTIIPNKFKEGFDESRLVIPLYDKNGNMFGVSGRSLNPKSELRYITIMFDETKPKIYGLDEVDFTEPYYVTEGAIDALFVNNSLAMVGADFDTTALEHQENMVIVFDNEPRNLQIVKRMEQMVKDGFQIVIWPTQPEKKEDINDMVLKGLDVNSIIRKNTYKGLMAELKLSEWRKV